MFWHRDLVFFGLCVLQVDPSIVKTPWTEEEDKKIVVIQSKLGNRFAEITKLLEGRWVLAFFCTFCCWV